MAGRSRILVTHSIEQGQKDKLHLLAQRMFGGNASLALSAIIDAFEVPDVPPSMRWKPLSKPDTDAIGRAKRSTELNKAHAKRIREGKKTVE